MLGALNTHADNKLLHLVQGEGSAVWIGDIIDKRSHSGENSIVTDHAIDKMRPVAVYLASGRLSKSLAAFGERAARRL